MRALIKVGIYISLFFILCHTPKSYAYDFSHDISDFGGPWVVWVNLSNNNEITNMLRECINTVGSNSLYVDKYAEFMAGKITKKEWDDIKQLVEDEEKQFKYSLILIKLRPTGITNELVKKAVVYNDKKTIGQLDEIMHQDFLDFYGGFDGIIVYDEENGPQLSQIVRGKRTVTSEKIETPVKTDSFFKSIKKMFPPNAKKN